jgi:hypothetical protein
MKEITLSIIIGIDDDYEGLCDPECGYFLYGGGGRCRLFDYPLEGNTRCQDCMDAEKGGEG